MLFKEFQLADNPVGKILTWMVIAAFLFTTSCTTTRVIKAQPDTVQNELKKGDFVKITTKDGRRIGFRIDSIGSKSMIGLLVSSSETRGQVGTQQEILFDEIATIKKPMDNIGRTMVLISIPIILGILVLRGLGGIGAPDFSDLD